MTSRGRVNAPEITITQPEKKEKPPEPTLEERILAARDKFLAATAKNVEREITHALAENYHTLILNTLGLEQDHFGRGWRFSNYSRENELRNRALSHAQELIDKIDFRKVSLTVSQVNAIKKVYEDELKRHVTDAARQLAREDAFSVARKVLNDPDLNVQPDDDENEEER